MNSFSWPGVKPVRTGSQGPRAPMPPSSAFVMRIKHSFGKGTAVPNAELDHLLIDNRSGRRLLGSRHNEFRQGLTADLGATLQQSLLLTADARHHALGLQARTPGTR